MSRDLKRKFEDSDADPYCCSSVSSPPSYLSSPSVYKWAFDEENPPRESPHWRPELTFPHSLKSSLPSILKRTKQARRTGQVRFDTVTVFLFRRCQGFTSVPSHGGCTLGMEQRHSSCHRYSLSEHRAEQRRERREKLKDRLREEALKVLKQKLLSSGSLTREEAQRLTLEDVPEVELALNSVDEEAEEEGEGEGEDEDEEEKDEGYLPHSYSSKQRWRLLQRAGVVRIEREEKRQLQQLRRWREDCGCHCQGFCEPLTCTCSLAGIKCQMDRSNFPCGCTKDTCGNPAGRVEFNASRVQTHYIHTLMRLELESRLLDDKLQGRHPMRQQQDGDEDEDEDGDEDEGGQEAHRDTLGWHRSSMDDTLLSLESCASPPLTPLFPAPSFLFGAETTAEGENSCSSDTTDSSCFSIQSRDSEAALGPLMGTDDDRDTGHDLSLGESDDDPPFSSNRGDYSLPPKKHMKKAASLSQMSTSVFLDENANQTDAMFPYEVLPGPPDTPSPSIDDTSHSYMDLSLTSNSSLDFFDDLHDCHSSPVNSHLKEYSYLSDNFCSISSPGFHQGEDVGTQLLESLIGVA